VSGLISRRAFNIESIAAGYTEEEDVTRINIVVSVNNELELDQVVNQLNKLIDIIKIVNLTKFDPIQRELVMIKVKASPATRTDIMNIVEIFRAKIVDINRETMVIELTGEQSKIDALCNVLKDHEIIEIARTGAIALSRGPIPAKRL
jgi:acetolactate synthase-1/3 small subunit